MDFLKKHGEKLLLILLLVGLGLSAFLVMTSSYDDGTSSAMGGRSQTPPVNTEALDTLLGRLSGNPVMLASSTNVFTATPRVICINPSDRSLIPVGSKVCPYCGATQEVQDRDSDGDGILDKVEGQFGLDPNNPRDALEDMDNDGFSNLSEYQGGFNMSDPNSHPPLIAQLRLDEVQEKITRIRLLGFARSIRPGAFTLQLEWLYPNENSWHSGFITTGRRFGANNEFLAERFDEKRVLVEGLYKDQSVGVIQAGRNTLRLRTNDLKGGEIRESSATLMLLNRPEWTQTVRIGETFSLDGVNYKVIDIQRQAVVIQAGPDAASITVREPLPEELPKPVPEVMPDGMMGEFPEGMMEMDMEPF